MVRRGDTRRGKRVSGGSKRYGLPLFLSCVLALTTLPESLNADPNASAPSPQGQRAPETSNISPSQPPFGNDLTRTPPPGSQSQIPSQEGPPLSSLLEAISKKDSLVEILMFEVDHATLTFSLDRNLPNYSRLIRGYERLVERVCFRNLRRTLQYTPQEQADSACVVIRQELLRLHPLNALGTCAEKGLEHQDCFTAASQVKQQQNLSIPPAADIDQQKKYEALNDLSNTIYSLLRQPAPPPQEMGDSKDDPQIAQAKKLAQLVNYYIQTGCSIEEYGLESRGSFASPQNPPTKAPGEAFSYGKTSGAKDSAPEGPRPLVAPMADAENLVRVRYTSRYCADAISLARDIDSSLGMIRCGTFGGFSPQCIEGLKEDRKRQSAAATSDGGTTTAKKKKSRMFSEF